MADPERFGYRKMEFWSWTHYQGYFPRQDGAFSLEHVAKTLCVDEAQIQRWLDSGALPSLQGSDVEKAYYDTPAETSPASVRSAGPCVPMARAWW